MPSCSRNLAIVLFSLLILGAGCSVRPTQSFSSSTSTSTITTSTEVSPVRNLSFDNVGSQQNYVILQGDLFSDATTTLYVHKNGQPFEPTREITGRYAEEGGKNIGLIIGQDPVNGDWNHVVFGIKPLDMYFHEGGSFVTVTGTWMNDGKEFSGTIQSESDKNPRSFTLHAIAQTDILGSAEIKFQRVAESWSMTPWVDLCEYKLEYPEATDAVNALVRETLLDPGMKSFKQQAEQFIQACKHEFPGSRPFGMSGNRSYTISTEITLNEHDILSLFFYIEHWEGGAHQSMQSKAVTMNLKTGKRMTLADVIKSEHLHEFIEYAGQKTLDQEYADLQQATPPIKDRAEFDQLEDFKDLRKMMASTTTMSVSEQIKRYGDLKNFYLTPKGLVVFYNSYELGMWANTPHVLLPFEEWKDWMKDGMRKSLKRSSNFLL